MLIQPGASEYVPGQGMVQQPDIEHPCTGAVFDFGLHQSGSAFTAGSLIEAGDKQLFLSPDGVPVAIGPGWRVITFPDIPEMSETYSVVSVKTTAPAGIPVLYEGQLRK
jgi:hypothetical protein